MEIPQQFRRSEDLRSRRRAYAAAQFRVKILVLQKVSVTR
jgi:hypothetical protein